MKIVVGVGIHSIPGSRIEQILSLLIDDPAQYAVVPIPELAYGRGGQLHDLQNRAIRYAQKMKDDWPDAELYLGVAGGIVSYHTRRGEGPAYVDIMIKLTRHNDDNVQNWILNHMDATEQVKKKQYYLASCQESITNLTTHLLGMVRVNTKPHS